MDHKLELFPQPGVETYQEEVDRYKVFVESYEPDATVIVGQGMQISLDQALRVENLLCTGDKSNRQDPDKRIKYIAGMLAAGGSLRPEHQHLVSEAE